MFRIDVIPKSCNLGDKRIDYFQEPFELYQYLICMDDDYFICANFMTDNISLYPRIIKECPKTKISYIKTNFPFSGKISVCKGLIRKDSSVFGMKTEGFTANYVLIFSHGLICLIMENELYTSKKLSPFISEEVKKMVFGEH